MLVPVSSLIPYLNFRVQRELIYYIFFEIYDIMFYYKFYLLSAIFFEAVLFHLPFPPSFFLHYFLVFCASSVLDSCFS